MAANTQKHPAPIDVDRLGRPLVGPCHLWVKAVDRKGYGVIGNRDFGSTTIQRAHRVAYALAHGIPLTDLRSVPELDHLCRMTQCCAPRHLEAVSHGENVKRGNVAAINGSKTHCKRGHPFDEANTRTYRNRSGGTSRACRHCQRDASRATYDPAARHDKHLRATGRSQQRGLHDQREVDQVADQRAIRD